MSYASGGAAALDYFACRYGDARVKFRGPKRPTDGDYIAFLGGTETYGRFIPRPYPSLVEERLGIPCVNFGWLNAGPDAFLHDQSVIEIAQRARAVVIQVPGAEKLSNRYYAVHPRRNDRFLEASGMMRKVFPTADFTEFHFVRHMLRRLSEVDPIRFAILVAELQQAWVARMGALLRQFEVPVLLHWFSDNPLPEQAGSEHTGRPMFVGRDMIDAIAPRPVDVIDCTASERARAAGTTGMVFTQKEAAAAAEVLGPVAHTEAAERLSAHLSDVLALQM